MHNLQELVYVSNARAIIANTACNYSAYAFFNDKQGIAMVMQMELNRKFQHKMGATVEALQISDVRVHSMSKVIGARDASRAGAPVGVGSDSLMSVVLTFRWRLPRLLIIGTEPDDCVSCFSGRAARRFSECHRDFDCNEAKHHEV